jgi:hypothetical protein
MGQVSQGMRALSAVRFHLVILALETKGFNPMSEPVADFLSPSAKDLFLESYVLIRWTLPTITYEGEFRRH